MEYFTLNDGNKIPATGFGTFQITDPEQAEQSVIDAIESGYRLIDTAQYYKNEEAVGRGLKKSGVKCEDLFVTSKVWFTDSGYDKAKKMVETSLKKLGLDYLDMYLIHQPYGDTFGSWRALEEMQKEGKIKSIGVSNFYDDQITNLAMFNDVKPVIDQIEINPWEQQKTSVDYLKSFGVRPEAWAPFAEGKHDIFNNETLKSIGEKYGKSVGQVILRWEYQRGIVTLAKSTHKDRMEENIDIFDFELSEDDMKQIANLDKGESQFFDHRDPITIQNFVK
ncbi:aldo/keto reductase [Fructilactobacillus fructivorans]|uniref:aldo/keto reductase n=1 Tax=Fructilactobacillus fructivorans TaxID=1614 RepID=UPI0007054AF4|nr:aldo/keto reductase [Fructilactobacillus fructivorans]KRN41247.1 organophosphate reductase [Fructilactobacillus fructivorans]KRN43062.1 organophosphate reductase [Fructilactobacillus fructivorans]